jgi:hypothetical protein
MDYPNRFNAHKDATVVICLICHKLSVQETKGAGLATNMVWKPEVSFEM